MTKIVKPRFTGVIVDVKPGHVPPEGYIKKAMEENKSFCTFAALSSKGGMSTSHDEEEGDFTMPSFEEFMKFLEESKEDRRVLYLADYPKDFKIDDVQPFNLCSNTDGDVLMSIFVEGDFPNFALDAQNEDRSEEGLFFDNILGPYLEERLTELDNDFEKLVQSLHSKNFENLIINPSLGHRGVCMFLPRVGEARVIGKNTVGGEYEWGNVSHNYGWNDAPAMKHEEPVKTFSFGRKKAATADAKPLPDGVHEVKPETPTKDTPAPANDKPVETETAFFKQPGEWKSAPSHLKGNKLQGWYHQMMGIPAQLKLDFEWRKQPRIFVPTNKNIAPRVEPQIKSFGEVKNAIEAKRNIAAESENMILSADEITQVMDFCMKVMPEKTAIIPPLEMQKAEEKLVTFEEAIGVGLDEVHNWPIGALFSLAIDKPKAAALLLIGYRRRSIMAKALMGDETLKDIVGTINTEKANDTHVEAKNILAPEKTAGKFSFGRKNKAA